MYENRKFLIIPVSEIAKINFNQICETSAETLRLSVDGSKTFIKWDQAVYDPTPYEIANPETGEIELITPTPPQPPAFVNDIEGAEGPYTHEEILEILNTPEWVPAEDIVIEQVLSEQTLSEQPPEEQE